MAQRSASRLLDLDPVDHPDKHDEEMGKCYEEFLINTGAMSTNELHAYVHDTAAVRATMLALLYSVLTDRTKADSDFELLRVSNRDNYGTILRELEHLIESPYFPRMKSDVRRQLFWMVDRLTAANVAGVETLHLQLLRQIPGGDISQSTATLCKLLLDLCETHRIWVEGRTRVLHAYVYIFLRTIADHKSASLRELQQSEIVLIIKLLRHNWLSCCAMGRDLIRALQDVSKIPEIASLWEDILNRPQSLHKSFDGMLSILQTQTPPELLRFRLTPQMEMSLRWIFDKLTASNYQRNLEWFVKRWLSSPATEHFYADVIRYIVAGWYPSNELLQSNKVPRYAIIGTLFTYIKSHVTAANVKLSLFLDWLFFADDSNIMLIEPAMLLMERSIKYHPYITGMLVEFLRFAVDEYHPTLSGHIMKCVGTGMKNLLRKGVIKRLTTIYNYPTIDDVTKRQLMDMFASSLDFTSNSRQPTPQQGEPSLHILNEDNAMTDVAYVSSETKANSRATTPAAPEGEDQELDEYLYGTDTMIEENHVVLDTTAGDQIMTDVNTLSGINDSPHIEFDRDTMETPDVHTPSIHTPDPSRKSEEMDAASTHDLSADKISDFEEDKDSDDDVDGREQNQQSFWMFADLLPRFQDASRTIKTACVNNDIDEIQAHSYICKKNLREILNIYLKMAIPAKNLVPNLAKYIRDGSCSKYVNSGKSENDHFTLDQEETVQVETMDAMDLLFVTIWSLWDSESQRKKMVDFISCVMHLSRRGGKHLVGMRWWSFFSRVLQAEHLSIAPLFPAISESICEVYQSIILSNPDLSTDSINEEDANELRCKQYLAKDLMSLQDSDLLAVQQVTPIIFKFLPRLSVGNNEIIRILISSLLPDKISVLSSQLSCKYLKVFGSEDLGPIIIESLSWETFEQIVFWRLLQAEIGTCADKVDSLMDAIATENILEIPEIPELLIALPTIITSIPPNPSAIRHLMSMLPEVTSISRNIISTVVEILDRWKGRYLEDLQDGVTGSLKELISAIKSDPNDAVIKVGSLLSQLITLGDLVNSDIPPAWRADASKKSKKRQSIAVFSDSE
ncbi:protein-domain-containing protein [Umbelopsis sp. AD052]|nr:protein-domain-containing protein [Umbelopsis sp. AD052]